MAEKRRQADLGARLRQGSAQEVAHLIWTHRDELTIREVRHVLLNPYVNTETIDALLAVRRLLSTYEVRSAIVRHPRSPQATSLRFLAGLYWRDLTDIGRDVRLAPGVRRAADKYLIQRLPGLAVGERVAIAHRASLAILGQLRHDPNPRVIKALLDNPRLTGGVLLPLVTNKSTRPQTLDLVASHERWGSSYEVRVALSRNPMTPFRAVFAILPDLRRDDLLALSSESEPSSIVIHRVRELLEARRRPRKRQKSR